MRIALSISFLTIAAALCIGCEEDDIFRSGPSGSTNPCKYVEFRFTPMNQSGTCDRAPDRFSRRFEFNCVDRSNGDCVLNSFKDCSNNEESDWLALADDVESCGEMNGRILRRGVLYEFSGRMVRAFGDGGDGPVAAGEYSGWDDMGNYLAGCFEIDEGQLWERSEPTCN